MDKLGIEKTKQAIEDGLIVYEDVKKALEDDNKVSLMEGGVLAIKHSGKLIRLITSIQEIGKEVVDIDSAEAAELTGLLTEAFGGSEAAEEAVLDIATGAGYLNQGIQKLIALKKG
jgi:hypothetical protein